MNIVKSIILASSVVLITSCKEKQKKVVIPEIPKSITQKVDDAVHVLESKISNLKTVTTLDHHRMAAAVGVYTPPAIATVFSDPKINTALIKKNQLIGLDLPYKILCYSEADTTSVKLAYTASEFIQKRHNLDDNLLLDYKSNMNTILASFPEEMLSKTDLSGVDEGFGIIRIKSDFDFSTTIQNLKAIVMAQGDTKWFADINFQNEASEMGVIIKPTVLLLFGGPAPGGKAMMTTQKIGLDAFCQKLLVYQNDTNEIWVAYNDIVAFSKLYYQTSTKPQQVINQRLKMTFTKAISK